MRDRLLSLLSLLSPLALIAAAIVAPTSASALTLVDETLIIEMPYGLAEGERIHATDSTIRVVGDGAILGPFPGFAPAQAEMELRGFSRVELDSVRPSELALVDIYDDSQLILTNGAPFYYPGLLRLHDRASFQMLGGGLNEGSLFLDGESTALLSDGLIGSGGDGSLQVSGAASFVMTGGTLVTALGTSFGGALAQISGGSVRNPLSLDAGLVEISGGEFQNCNLCPEPDVGLWTLAGASLVVRGSGLVLAPDGSSRYFLTGFLEDGSPLNVEVRGDVGNVSLLNAPEPRTGLLITLGLSVALALRRRRHR